MYRVSLSKKFAKAIHKRRKGGRMDIVRAAEEVAILLAVSNAPAGFVLREQWRDHALKGQMAGLRELHLSQDELLVYERDENLREITLVDILSHEQLKKFRK